MMASFAFKAKQPKSITPWIKIVRIKRNISIIQELSVSGIEAKEKDEKGFYTLNVDKMQER
jgi:hypothetical protein